MLILHPSGHSIVSEELDEAHHLKHMLTDLYSTQVLNPLRAHVAVSSIHHQMYWTASTSTVSPFHQGYAGPLRKLQGALDTCIRYQYQNVPAPEATFQSRMKATALTKDDLTAVLQLSIRLEHLVPNHVYQALREALAIGELALVTLKLYPRSTEPFILLQMQTDHMSTIAKTWIQESLELQKRDRAAEGALLT